MDRARIIRTNMQSLANMFGCSMSGSRCLNRVCALFAEHRCDTGFGDAVATTDLLSGFAGFGVAHDGSDVVVGEEAFVRDFALS